MLPNVGATVRISVMLGTGVTGMDVVGTSVPTSISVGEGVIGAEVVGSMVMTSNTVGTDVTSSGAVGWAVGVAVSGGGSGMQIFCTGQGNLPN